MQITASAVAAFHHAVTAELQGVHETAADRFVVLDHEDQWLAHGASSLSQGLPGGNAPGSTLAL